MRPENFAGALSESPSRRLRSGRAIRRKSTSAAGARMGRGRGYYDKYLSQPGFRGVKAGVCYAHQLVGELPVEPHDVFMDYVVTND